MEECPVFYVFHLCRHVGIILIHPSQVYGLDIFECIPWVHVLKPGPSVVIMEGPSKRWDLQAGEMAQR